MGIIKAFSGAIAGTLGDQWKDIITAGEFNEHTIITPGIIQTNNNGRGSNSNGSKGIISNGSKIYVPENTVAVVLNQSKIEEFINEPGGYEYTDGQDSIFNGDGITSSILNQVKDRINYGGQSSDNKQIIFVNLREFRGIKFGTKGPLVYNDKFYGTDLEILSYGTISIKVTNPELLLKNYIPANTTFYSFDNPQSRNTILSELLQSLIVSLNSLSENYRISQLPSQANVITQTIKSDTSNAGTWPQRFGFELTSLAFENISFSPESKKLVNQYSSNKMNVKAYEDVSEKAASIAAQQKIAEGIKDNGLGDGGGMIYGMNIAKSVENPLEPPKNSSPDISLDEQIENIKKLKELLDAGILTQEEFEIKKKEILKL